MDLNVDVRIRSILTIALCVACLGRLTWAGNGRYGRFAISIEQIEKSTLSALRSWDHV